MWSLTVMFAKACADFMTCTSMTSLLHEGASKTTCQNVDAGCPVLPSHHGYCQEATVWEDQPLFCSGRQTFWQMSCVQMALDFEEQWIGCSGFNIATRTCSHVHLEWPLISISIRRTFFFTWFDSCLDLSHPYSWPINLYLLFVDSFIYLHIQLVQVSNRSRLARSVESPLHVKHALYRFSHQPTLRAAGVGRERCLLRPDDWIYKQPAGILRRIISK